MNIDKTLEVLAKVYADNVRLIVKANIKEMIKEDITKALELNDGEVVTDIEFIDIYITALKGIRRDII